MPIVCADGLCQGHGIVRLDSTLGYPGRPLDLYVRDTQTVRTHDVVAQCVRYDGASGPTRRRTRRARGGTGWGSRYHLPRSAVPSFIEAVTQLGMGMK